MLVVYQERVSGIKVVLLLHQNAILLVYQVGVFLMCGGGVNWVLMVRH